MIREVREWLHDVMPVLVVVMLAVVVLSGLLGIHASSTGDANAVSIATLQQEFAQNKAQAAVLEKFLKAFTVANNYECSVLWYINHANASIPEPPSLSICQVIAP